MKASVFSILAILILASCVRVGQEAWVHPSPSVLQQTYKVGWKLPVGVLESAAVSQDGEKILLPANFDGYYLYDSKGQLVWRLPDPHAGFGEFSADGKLILLTDSWHVEGQKVSLIDAADHREKWNFTLDRVDYARLSPGSQRVVILGAVHLATGGWQKLFVVKERDGTDLVSLRFGHSGEYLQFDEGSQPCISWDGRYVAVGTWGREQRDYWLYFADLNSGKSWNATVHEGVSLLAVSKNGTLLVAATASTNLVLGLRRIHVFDTSGKLLWSSSPDMFRKVDFWDFLGISDSGEYLAVVGGGNAWLLDRSGEELWSFQTPARVQAFAMDNEASRFVIGDSEGVVHLLDRSGRTLSTGRLAFGISSVSLGGSPEIMAAVEGDNVIYVMDAEATILWKHVEIPGFEFALFNVETSTDGRRVAVGYPRGLMVFDEDGTTRFTFKTYLGGVETSPPPSSLTSDGRFLATVSTEHLGDQWKPVVVWFDMETYRQVSNVTLRENELVDSLSMSGDGSLLVVSGWVTDTYAFIYAFDSQGHKLWECLDNRAEPYLLIHSKMAVSQNGSIVAAARQQYGIFGGGTNNGVVLFNREGKVLWNYTTQEPILNVAISKDGKHVVAASDSQLYGFDTEGRVLQGRISVGQGAIIAISGTGERFIVGEGERLFLGNATGYPSPIQQTDVNGQVESVAISDSGDTSAAIITRDYQNTRTARLIYIMDENGRLLANYTFLGPTKAKGGSRVAVSGNGCCVVAALETDGIYYFQRSAIETQTATISTLTSTGGQTVTTYVSTAAPLTPLIEWTLTAVSLLLVGSLGFLTLLRLIKYRRWPK